MKRITLSILLVILSLGVICNVYAQSAWDLWPLHLGNQWTYRIEGQINDGHEFKVEVTKRWGGWAFLKADDEFHGTGWGERWWWTSPHTKYVWTWDPKSFSFGLVFRLVPRKGYQFTSNINGIPCLDGVVWRVADVHATVTTPVGTFKDCLIIEVVEPTCADAGLTRMVFAPSVGIIEYSWTTIAGGHTAKLIHAVVDGTVYTQIEPIRGYSVSMNIDKITYTLTENHMPPIPIKGPPQQPDTLKAKLIIDNGTDEMVSFTHSSSQQYDFIIRDDSGTEVYRWSNDRDFLMAITNKNLAPGEFVVYQEDIELRDNDGNPIQSGDYTIEGLHTTMIKNNELQQRGIAAFKIDLLVVH